ncbi:MAG: hypothetical protein AAF211_30860, partial [Myxococcota bacterium]
MIRTFLVLSPLIACAGDDPTSKDDSGSPPMPTGNVETADTGPGSPVPLGVTVKALTSSGEGPTVPAAGAVFSVADDAGRFVRSATADADGEARFEEVPAGGSVTVVLPVVVSTSAEDERRDYEFATVFGVRDGDVLQFGTERTVPVLDRGTVTLDLTANPAPGSPGIASVWASCGGQATVLGLPSNDQTMFLFGDCQPGPVDVLAVNYTDLQFTLAVGYLPTTIELDADRNADVSLDGWETDPGRVLLRPDPALAGAPNFHVDLVATLGDERIVAARVQADSPQLDVDAVVTTAFDSAWVQSFSAFSSRRDPVSPIPGPGQSVEVALTPTDFLPP